jgi:hypothetical protein
MNAQIQTRREAINSSAGDDTAKDLFSLFVRASENEGSKMGFSNEELVPLSTCSDVVVLNARRSGTSLYYFSPAMVRSRYVDHSGVSSNSSQRLPRTPWQLP